jgi:hypothetical protein
MRVHGSGLMAAGSGKTPTNPCPRCDRSSRIEPHVGPAPNTHLAVLLEDAVHRSDGTEIRVLVEQLGIDLTWRLVHEALAIEHLEHAHLLFVGERANGLGPR